VIRFARTEFTAPVFTSLFLTVSEVENEQNNKPTEFELILLIYKTYAPVQMHQLVAPVGRTTSDTPIR